MVDFEHVITDSQLKFILWVKQNHMNDLESHQHRIVKQALHESKEVRERGYMNNSLFQRALNEIRDLYLKEYIKKW